MNIDADDFIDDIECYEKMYQSNNNRELIKLSFWNPITEVSDRIKELIPKYNNINDIEYIFTYEIDNDIKKKILQKLCGTNSENELVLTPSGSISIYNVINIIKQLGKKRLAMITPVYFTVPFVCDNLKIECNKFALDKKESEFYIDERKLKSIESHDVIWITNPVYCSSTYYNTKFISQIRKWLKLNKLIILDESLALNNKELIKIFHESDNVISICSPQKSICINGRKFSAIITPRKHYKLFNIWADIITGCLSISNYKALLHFLSDDYQNVYNYFNDVTSNNMIKVANLCKRHNVEYDENAHGSLISLYFKHLPYSLGDNQNFIKNIILTHGISFIPGSRNHLNENVGFSFRINLSRINENALERLEELLIYLNNYKYFPHEIENTIYLKQAIS